MTIFDQAQAGLPLDVPVIDAHTHIDCYFGKGWHQNPAFTTLEAFLLLQDKLGINCSVTAPHSLIDGMSEAANARAAEAAGRYPGRIYGYISITPNEGMDACRRNIQRYGPDPAFVGFKFLGGYNGDYSETEYQYALDFAGEARCPVLCHTWANKPELGLMAKLAEKRPGMKLLIAHQGGGREKYTRQAAQYMQQVPNLYMELCGSLYNTLSFAEIAGLVDPSRLIFGTDAINLDPRYDFGRLAYSELEDPVKKQIFAGNFLRLLEDSQMGKLPL